MKYAIIIGSHRKGSQSTKVGKYIANELRKLKETVTIIDLANNPLPLWGDASIKKKWAPYKRKLQQADALVVISPEWGGMVPSGLKNLFLLCGHELAHKPALIVTVSASRGGAYPVAELRMSSYKNNYLCYIPEHIIVRDVNDMLNDTKLDETNKADFYLKKRLSHALGVLQEYAKAFVRIRKSKKTDMKDYNFGM
ncbi:NAD(P)H-dependent oxidoreductase [Candidatus Woesearchaeota archaeon]|jgi:multimeric flavodoxin WrbA|nr:NAD(P)H-dependent oxidoreductase [Candidatus Woesearchaeota archaeon]MBT5740649.1 NAD(P)H-dependent oxidoreductase [Candidatus Woesearchaeota archaeon]MBT6402499.1 NAD(P)H-dependent oxidoreductase [Candidatus Woesearchaeota archaeon]